MMAQLSMVIKEKGVTHLNGIDADRIANLLAQKHTDDVFVAECKNGETWGARDLLKLDAWVLKRTYSPLTTIGYEIKVSRQDFENDQKWTGYLDLCHTFFFVCPAGLIRSIDLPERVGLIWVSRTETLHTKRKAQRVDPDPVKLNRLLIYVLMARAKIVANMHEVNGNTEQIDKITAIRQSVDRANERKELAYFVKGHIKDVERLLKDKESDLSVRERQLKEFERRLAVLGITWDSSTANWQDNMRIQSEIDLLKQRIDYRTLESIRRTGKDLIDLATLIEGYRKEGEIPNKGSPAPPPDSERVKP